MDGICFYNRHVITGRGTHPVTLCGNDIESNECANVELYWYGDQLSAVGDEFFIIYTELFS